MFSSRRKQHKDSSSGSLNGPRDETRTSRSRHEDNTLAIDNPTQTSGPVSRPQQPLGSETFRDRSRAQPNQSILPFANIRDNSKGEPSQSAHPSTRVRQNTNFTTAYTKPEDIEMAEKQKKYKTLTAAEQRQQDKWAQKKLMGLIDACPSGFRYELYHQVGYEGYRCQGGAHLITHTLLAEGKGGYYTMGAGRTSGIRSGSLRSGFKAGWSGPVYPGQEQDDGWNNSPVSNLMSRRIQIGGRRPGPGMMRGYGGGNNSSPFLPSKNFRDESTAGPSNSSNIPPPVPKKEHSKDIPVSYIPTTGGRLDPNYKPPPGHGETDWTIYARPAARNQVKDRLEKVNKLLTYPEGTENDPSYRSNYRTITTEQDKAMAEKELRIDTLSPAEQAVQKQWAKSLLKKNRVCPEGFGWWAYKTNEQGSDGCKLNGYRCWAGGHLVTHELLVEDQGRYYSLITNKDNNDDWTGPVYPRVRHPLFKNNGIALLTLADERGEPHWKDPNWRSSLWKAPWERGSKSKKSKR
ncbi:hypothetical protein IFR05_007672 [Cadophora sp. M221]|nr:hypothetical protein IFR05_007672 [Cadophora sp. M221]